MSTVSTVIFVAGFFGTILFVAGFVRGLRQALNSRTASRREAPVSDNGHWLAAGLAVVCSALVIASIGFTPAAVYAGPFLVIVTAAATGLAFFLDPGEGRTSN